MLDPRELKTVLDTLTKRRNWLIKSLENADLGADIREETTTAIKLLDSSMQKLVKLSNAFPSKSAIGKPSPPPTFPPRKSHRKAPVEPENACALIAEDNHDSAELLRGILLDMGMTHIDVVTDGRAALYALQNCSPPYDLVLCDWDMPEMNGLEVYRSVRPLAKLRDMHFVMVTAVSASNRIREAIQLGVDDYLVKPIDIEILERKIRAALAGGEAAT